MDLMWIRPYGIAKIHPIWDLYRFVYWVMDNWYWASEPSGHSMLESESAGGCKYGVLGRYMCRHVKCV